MTIRKQWLIVLTLTAVLAVSINSLLLSSLINRYFQTYAVENYNAHLSQIQELARNALVENSFSPKQLSVQFESHLDDPILSIRLYDARGRLIAAAENKLPYGHDMMSNRMRERMSAAPEEVDSVEISDGEAVLGILNITRYCPINNSVVSNLFRFSLIRNSLISFVIVMLVLVAIGIFVSKKMSQELTNTAGLAIAIDVGDSTDIKLSKIKEIKIIQESLNALSSKLKIKQLGRKRLVDELVHQVRTPLTILKAHLEGLGDGMIELTPEEVNVCSEQVENVTSIVANMSMMLDANISPDAVKAENVEISSLFKQIVNGLKLQFDKKQINLHLLNQQKTYIMTDKYKLSQSVYNILTNAYKFTPAGGTVDISYSASPNGLEIVIKDSGIGIPSQEQENLFDAYYRGGNSGKTGGEGLGLFVAKENILKLNGDIRVDSQAGKGSVFTISIGPLKSEIEGSDARGEGQN